MHFFSFITLDCSTLIRYYQLENVSREKFEKKIVQSMYWSEVIGIACTLLGRARLASAQFIC